ncbi:hypothetical protein [Bradyrhizobium ivorense]|nr:hypothetical protein [Bradyrhizobium ivorense]
MLNARPIIGATGRALESTGMVLSHFGVVHPDQRAPVARSAL